MCKPLEVFAAWIEEFVACSAQTEDFAAWLEEFEACSEQTEEIEARSANWGDRSLHQVEYRIRFLHCEDWGDQSLFATTKARNATLRSLPLLEHAAARSWPLLEPAAARACRAERDGDLTPNSQETCRIGIPKPNRRLLHQEIHSPYTKQTGTRQTRFTETRSPHTTNIVIAPSIERNPHRNIDPANS